MESKPVSNDEAKQLTGARNVSLFLRNWDLNMQALSNIKHNDKRIIY